MGTAHSASISVDETWTAAESPHRVSTRLSVGARLTIEPCAVVLLSGSGQLYLDAAGGKFVAEGTADRPILIQGQGTGATNSTRGVWTTASQGESIRLAHVTIDGIGDGNDGFGDYAIALQSTEPQTLHVDTVTIRNTYGGGVGFDQRALLGHLAEPHHHRHEEGRRAARRNAAVVSSPLPQSRGRGHAADGHVHGQ